MSSVHKRGLRVTLRARVLAIALVPSLVLLSAGVALSSYLLVNAAEQRDSAQLLGRGYQMAVPFMPAMSEERRASILVVSDPAPQNRLALNQARRDMDALFAQFGSVSAQVANAMPAKAKAAIGVFVGKLPQLMATRQAIDAGTVSRLDVYRSYSEVADAMIVAAGAIGQDSTDKDVALQRTTAADLMRVADWLDRGNALAAGALAGGGLTPEESQEYNRLTQGYHAQLDALIPRLGNQQAQFEKLRSSRAWQQLSTVETYLVQNGLVAAGRKAEANGTVDRGAGDSESTNAGNSENSGSSENSGAVSPDTARNSAASQLPVSLQDWQNAARDSSTALSSMGLGGLGTQAAAAEADKADSALTRSLIAALAMLVIIGVVIVIAVRLSNNLARRLIRLRTETLKVADERLPQVVQRLRAGERIDIAVAVPDLDHGRDEIGQVAAAFNKAQQTAVAAAVQEAKTRDGINAVFLNIARRSQAIVHRQLQVLDTAERASDDPDQLELLFQLDHATTRERRNAENLIILGGGQLGRQWRNPVSLVDIVRSAVAEAEQYTRVTVDQVPHVLVDGRAVADVIHLLAELIDNATSFSPPGSRIEVRGNPVGRGVVVEVDDQGLGIEAERRQTLNEMFRNPPDFGLMALSDDARVGFFVVAHLAHQHGIQVSLMESTYGGVRAGVLIPTGLMTAPDPADGADGGGAPTLEHSVLSRPDPTAGWIPSQVAADNGDEAVRPAAYPEARYPETGHPEARHTEARHTEARHAANGSNGTGQLVASRAPGADERPALPRRRRQEHLSRRLQEEPATDTHHRISESGSDHAARHARDTLSAFYRGTQRGRAGGDEPGP